MKKVSFYALSLVVLVFLAGCTSYQGQGFHISEFFGGEGYDFKEHIKKKDWKTAHSWYNKHHKFFEEHTENYKNEVGLVALQVNLKNKASLLKTASDIQGVKWPVKLNKWNDVKSQLKKATAIRQNYESSKLLMLKKYQSSEYKNLKSSIEKLKSNIKNNASGYFATFNHLGKENFFQRYPILLNKKQFLTKNFSSIDSKVSAYDTKQLDIFLTNYPKSLFDDNLTKKIDNLYFSKMEKEVYPRNYPNLLQFLDLISKAIKKGINTKDIIAKNLKIIDATTFALNEKFNIKISNDTNYTMVVKKPNGKLTHNYTVVFTQKGSKYDLKQTGKRNQYSQYYFKSNFHPNPKYKELVEEEKQARAKLQSAQHASQEVYRTYSHAKSSVESKLSSFLRTSGCSRYISYQDKNYNYCSSQIENFDDMLSKLKSDFFQKDLETKTAVTTANITLAGVGYRFKHTPKLLEEKIYKDYQYQVISIKGKKQAVLMFNVVDKRNLQHNFNGLKKTFKRDFKVIQNLHKQDKNHFDLVKKYDTKKATQNWAKRSIEVKLKDLMISIDNVLRGDENKISTNFNLSSLL